MELQNDIEIEIERTKIQRFQYERHKINYQRNKEHKLQKNWRSLVHCRVDN